MTGRERRLLRMLCMTAGSGGGGGGDKPWEEMTWDEVIAATKNGKYKNFEIGAMKELDLGTEGIIHMQIVGIDADDLADGSGKAPLTFISKELLKTSHRMNPERTPSSTPYNEGTGSVGGWDKSEMKQYILNTVIMSVPEIIRNSVKAVTKYTRTANTYGEFVQEETTETFWLASRREMLGDVANAETQGPIYHEAFPDDESRTKKKPSATNTDAWWLRSAGNAKGFYFIYTNGTSIFDTAHKSYAIALGFCL